jgi:hypothetical protein
MPAQREHEDFAFGTCFLKTVWPLLNNDDDGNNRNNNNNNNNNNLLITTNNVIPRQLLQFL